MDIHARMYMDVYPNNYTYAIPTLQPTRGLLTCTCLNCTWREALNCSVWIDFHIYMLVRTDLSRSLKGVEMHTWSSDWKRVISLIVIRGLLLV